MRCKMSESCYGWKGAYLRRLYSTFAGGWPGTGLLLMRVIAGSALVVRAGLTLWSDPPPMNVTIPAVLLIGAGVLLIAGLWTPIAGTFVALIEIWKMLMLAGDKWVWLMLGTTGAALAMLGPGLWSVDARLYGWKRLETPPSQKSSDLLKNSPKDCQKKVPIRPKSLDVHVALPKEFAHSQIKGFRNSKTELHNWLSEFKPRKGVNNGRTDIGQKRD